MSDEKARWIGHQLAGIALRTTANLLREAGVPVVPVKGIVLGRWLYSDVVERPLRDVDLLVSRGSFERAVRALESAGHSVAYLSHELGEALFDVGGFDVALHAEIGRRDLTSLTVDDVLGRAVAERDTFDLEILRIDDVDHFILLAANVVKDYFVAANPHQPDDLRRMAERLQPRLAELVARAREANFLSGLRAVSHWLEETGDDRFRELTARIGPPPRRLQAAALSLLGKSSRVPRPLSLAVACWTNDDFRTRVVAVRRLGWRGAMRLAGREPG